VLKKYI